MVHALQEAHRALKSNGILIDLRPAAENRRVGIVSHRHWRAVGTMREKFDDDVAANRALATVLRRGLFRQVKVTRFDLSRQMDTLDDFRAWLDEFTSLAALPSHEWLLEKLESFYKEPPNKAKIVVWGPLILRVLRKIRHVGK